MLCLGKGGSGGRRPVPVAPPQGAHPASQVAVFHPQAHAEPPGVSQLQLQLHGRPGGPPLLLQRLHFVHRGPIVPRDAVRRQWQAGAARRESGAVSECKAAARLQPAPRPRVARLREGRSRPPVLNLPVYFFKIFFCKGSGFTL